MGELFSGLEQFGLEKLKNIDIYEKESGRPGNGPASAQEVKKVEADFLFDKTYTCPVCDNTFKSKTVRVGKVKLLSSDTDLRPRYQFVDAIKYDAVACPKCGYAALSRFFNYMTNVQARLVKEQITSTFKPFNNELSMYTYDQAIMRYKLALVNTIVTRGKNSERAYTCLKLAWLYRGRRETLPSTIPNYEKIKLGLFKIELDFLKNAYEGFCTAFMKEDFPICGMDENTVNYLAAELARRLGKTEEALKFVSRILISREANERIKNKAREVKDRIKIANETKKG
ncbi:MAG: DUF2225 domain-containing protein [bacterium]|nr:DUF2225 domain-containing protein [bacterium]